jgi:hypothetical protein
VYITGSVAGTVYYDQEDDNMLNNSNPGLSGQAVTLSGTNMHGAPVVLVTTTDANGEYLFTDVEPGSYVLTYANSSSYTPDSSQAGTTTGSTTPDAQTITTDRISKQLKTVLTTISDL